MRKVRPAGSSASDRYLPSENDLAGDEISVEPAVHQRVNVDSPASCDRQVKSSLKAAPFEARAEETDTVPRSCSELSKEAVRKHTKKMEQGRAVVVETDNQTLRWGREDLSERSCCSKGSKASVNSPQKGPKGGSRLTDDPDFGTRVTRKSRAAMEVGSYECSLNFLKRLLFVTFARLQTEGSLNFIEFLTANATIILVTYQYGFLQEMTFDTYFALSYASDVVATASTAFRLYMLVLRLQHAAHDPKRSRLHHLRSQRVWIVINLSLTVPFDAILWFTGMKKHVYAIRLIHLIPSRSRLVLYFYKLEHSPAFSFLKARLLRTLFYFCLSAHVLGCVLAKLAMQEDSQHYHEHAIWREDNNNWNNSAYIRTVYFSILSISSVHTDDAGVDRSGGGGLDWEYFSAICITILTNIIFMYVSSNLTSIMLRTFQRIEEYRSKLTMVIVYLRRNRLSGRLSKLVLEHFRQAYENLSGELEEESLLKQMPLTLSREVRYEKNMRVLKRAPILFGSDKAVLRLLAILVRQVSFLPEETICTEGDVVRELLFLQAGALTKKEDDEDDDDDEDGDEGRLSGDEAGLSGDEEVSERPHPPSDVVTITEAPKGELQPVDIGVDDTVTESPALRLESGTKRRGSVGSRRGSVELRDANLPISIEHHEGELGVGRVPLHGIDEQLLIHARKESINMRKFSEGRVIVNAHKEDPHCEAEHHPGSRKHSCKSRRSSFKKGVEEHAQGAMAVVHSIAHLGKDTLAGLGVVAPEAIPMADPLIQTPGKAVCELAFFFGLRQHMSLMAVKQTTCLLLDMESWKLLAKEFPQDAHSIQKRVLEQAKAVDPELVHGVQVSAVNEEQSKAMESLFSVVGRGDEAAVEALVHPCQTNTDTSVVDYAGNTPLHVAVLRGHIAIVNVLLKHKAPVNAVDGMGRTPLAVSLNTGRNEIALAIRRAGGTLGWDEITTSGELCEAAKEGNLQKLSMFITCGADVNSADYDLRTPLHLAASTGNKQFVQILLTNGARINALDRWGGTPLRDSVRENHRRVASLLYEANGNLNYDDSECAAELCYLARNGDADRLQLLIECGCKVNTADYDDRRCIHLASSMGNKTIFQNLIDAGAEINCKDRWGGTPLNDSIKHGHLEMSKRIIQYGGLLLLDDLAASAELCTLAREGKLERVHLLLEGGANIDATDYDNRTCLHLAAATGNLLIVQALLNRKCNASIRDRWGGTPLADAIREGHHEVAKLLIRHNADLGFDEEKSAGTLCELARQGNMTLIHILLSAGCDVNASDYDYRTCLHLCASEGGCHLVEELIRFNANLDSKDRWADNDKRTCLHLAASTGNLKVVEALLMSNASINQVDRWGGTPLADAIREGHQTVAVVLRDAGAEVLYDDAKASSELCEMARVGNIEGIKLLLDGGCSINAADYDLRTCLHLAASNGNLSVVKALVERGCDVNPKDRWGATPLADAVRASHELVTHELRSSGAELCIPDERVASSLCELARTGDSKGIKMLLDAGASVNAQNYCGRTCLHLATSWGNQAVMASLLEAQANTNIADSDGRTCLHFCAITGQMPIAHQLLKVQSTNVNASDRWGGTPLSNAMRVGHIELAKEFVKFGASLLYKADRAVYELCGAARQGNLNHMELLIDGGVDPNARDYDNRSCLMLAASTGNLNVVKLLLEKGADVNAQDRWGGTAIADAVREGHTHVVRYLSTNKAQIFWDKLTAAGKLCDYAANGNVERLELLLDCGLDPMACDYDQRTPLHLAASAGHFHIVEHLLGRGVDVLFKDRWGATALDDARREGHLGVIYVLERAIESAMLSQKSDAKPTGA
ncbi:MAG: hypothetical protein SGPRY_003248 [Prymnesium sp.]